MVKITATAAELKRGATSLELEIRNPGKLEPGRAAGAIGFIDQDSAERVWHSRTGDLGLVWPAATGSRAVYGELRDLRVTFQLTGAPVVRIDGRGDLDSMLYGNRLTAAFLTAVGVRGRDFVAYGEQPAFAVDLEGKPLPDWRPLERLGEVRRCIAGHWPGSKLVLTFGPDATEAALFLAPGVVDQPSGVALGEPDSSAAAMLVACLVAGVEIPRQP